MQAANRYGDPRFLGLDRERQDPVNGVLDIGRRSLRVGTEQQFHRDNPDPLRRVRGDLFHAVQPAHFFLDRQDDSLLDLIGAGAGIHHGYLDHVEVELREDFLLDAERHDQAAQQQEPHQQVGGHRVTGHPGDGTARFVVVR